MADEQRIQIKGRPYDEDDGALQLALGSVYDTPERPRCLCVPDGVEMYIAKFQRYVVKRMPGTGSVHHPTCPSFEPEPGSSGLSELIGEAVVEKSPEVVELFLDFPLSRAPGRAVPRSEAEHPTDVTAPRRRMSLRALTHLLWERAGMQRFFPAMKGRRSWAVVRRHILEAATELQVKGGPLLDRLFLPEAFNEDRKAEISERHRAQLARLHTHDDDTRVRMALVIGEFKSVSESTYGRRVWIKHLPDVPLFIDEKAWARAERVFKPLLEAREADSTQSLRLVATALVYAKRDFIYQIDTLSFMVATEHWIPVDGPHDVALIAALTDQSRRFIKPLRYDAKSSAAYPNALLVDTGATPTPLHVVSALMDARCRTAVEKSVKTGAYPAWVWYTDQPMPMLPTAATFRSVEDAQS